MTSESLGETSIGRSLLHGPNFQPTPLMLVNAAANLWIDD